LFICGPSFVLITILDKKFDSICSAVALSLLARSFSRGKFVHLALYSDDNSYYVRFLKFVFPLHNVYYKRYFTIHKSFSGSKRCQYCPRIVRHRTKRRQGYQSAGNNQIWPICVRDSSQVLTISADSNLGHTNRHDYWCHFIPGKLYLHVKVKVDGNY